MIRWGQAEFSADSLARAKSAFRPDLYREALGRGAALPDETHEKGAGGYGGFMDAKLFEPDDLQAYVEQFPVRSDASWRAGTSDA